MNKGHRTNRKWQKENFERLGALANAQKVREKRNGSKDK